MFIFFISNIGQRTASDTFSSCSLQAMSKEHQWLLFHYLSLLRCAGLAPFPTPLSSQLAGSWLTSVKNTPVLISCVKITTTRYILFIAFITIISGSKCRMYHVSVLRYIYSISKLYFYYLCVLEEKALIC